MNRNLVNVSGTNISHTNNNNNNNNNNALDSANLNINDTCINLNHNNDNSNGSEDLTANQHEEMFKGARRKKNGTILEDIESGWDFVKPSEPPEVAKWMEYNEISSLKLRSEIV